MMNDMTQTRTRLAIHLFLLVFLGFASITMTACGEDDPIDIDENENENDNNTELDPTIFDPNGLSYTASLGVGNGTLCLDIDTGTPVEVHCEDNADDWDLMFESRDRSWSIWTNGGVKGVKGNKGGSIGPFTEDEVADMKGGDHVPGFFPDYIGGVFATYPWQTYDVMGTHDITANNRVYVIDTGADKFRVQLNSYYKDGVSGWITLRYGKVGEEEAYEEIEIDARGGGFGAEDGAFTYFDLDAGELVDIDDETARQQNTDWDIGFKRFDVVVNGGVSGPGEAQGAIADAQDALYDEDGNAIRSEFQAQTDDDALQAFLAITSDDGLEFITDSEQPFLISDGSPQSWFGVVGPPPIPPNFEAHPQHWWMVRGSKGDSYVKMRATDIEFVTQSFTFDMYIQPSPTP